MIRKNDKKRILAVDDAAIILQRITDALGKYYMVITVNSGLRFRVLGVGQGDPAGLFKDVEHRYPVFPRRSHADIRAGVFREPVSQILQPFGK